MSNPLLTLLKKEPEQAKSYHVKQIVGVCGKGNLKDGSECSREFREYLGIVPTEILLSHANDCLESSFENSGCVLQDVVNELGRRLEYKVEDGLYHGKQTAIGFDGVWNTGGHSLVVEVKTTDAFLTNLDTIEEYRQELITTKKVAAKGSSVLLVVGRQDTGGLEAQVRGSRHAWSMRIISVDALGKLVNLKERTEEDTVAKIHDLLTPFEYTRLDKIIDIAFTAAEDASESDEDLSAELGSAIGAQQQHTSGTVLKELRRAILHSLTTREKTAFVKRSRAAYSNPDNTIRAVVTLSKRYDRGLYWYAYHPQWDNFLAGSKKGFYVLGCVGRTHCIVIPFAWIHNHLDNLYTTENERRKYWHVHIEESGSELVLALKDGKRLSLQSFSLPLTAAAGAS